MRALRVISEAVALLFYLGLGLFILKDIPIPHIVGWILCFIAVTDYLYNISIINEEKSDE